MLMTRPQFLLLCLPIAIGLVIPVGASDPNPQVSIQTDLGEIVVPRGPGRVQSGPTAASGTR